jgi:hypothetical protein
VSGIKESSLSTGENCYTATNGGTIEAFFKLAKTVKLLKKKNQEKIFSIMVETVGLAGKALAKSYATATATDLNSDNGQRRACLPSAIPADSRLKKL